MLLKDWMYQQRMKRHWNQADVSRATGISTAEMSRIESGERSNPTKRTLEKISKGFQIPVNDILDDLNDCPKTSKFESKSGKAVTIDDPVVYLNVSRPFISLEGLNESQVRRVILYAEKIRREDNNNHLTMKSMQMS